MADKKAVNTAAQAQSDKTKKTSFFGKVKNFFKGIGKYFKDTKGELKKVGKAQQSRCKDQHHHGSRGRAGRSCRADPAGSHLRRRHPSDDRRLSALSGGKDHG